MTNEIVYINSIGENILQRLSGADMDSDTMLLTDNELLIQTARKNYGVYLVPTNCVSAQKTKRRYNSSDRADLDVRTSVNKIGEIVNLSQQLNSLYWEHLHSGKSIEANQELYWDICKLDVLSGVEIDKAKKEFTIDSGKEIDILKRKYHIEEDGKTLKPMFFKMITTENGYALPPDTMYRYFETPMDYLQKIISSANYRQARLTNKDIIPLMDIIKKPTAKSGAYNIVRDKIIEMIKFYKTRIIETYIGYDDKDKAGKQLAREIAAQLKQECENAISKMSSHEYLMYLVLKEVEKKENRSIKNLMFEIMFGNNGYMPICKSCAETIFNALVDFYSGNEEHALHHWCGIFDYPYDLEASSMTAVHVQPGRSRVSLYPSKLNTKQVRSRGTSYLDTVRHEAGEAVRIRTVSDITSLENNQDGFVVTKPIIKKWGYGHKPEEYELSLIHI